jgi:DNA-directed RNA polymerase subunit RPC12/RpoP
MVEGQEVWHITCRSCGRVTKKTGVGNELVGKQERMRCRACGHLGADLLRVWSQGPAPKKTPGR